MGGYWDEQGWRVFLPRTLTCGCQYVLLQYYHQQKDFLVKDCSSRVPDGANMYDLN